DGDSEELAEFSESFSTELLLTFISPILDFDGDGTSEFLVGVKDDSPLIWRFGEPLSDETSRFERFYAGDRVDSADYNGDARPDVTLATGTSAMRATATTSFNVVP